MFRRNPWLIFIISYLLLTLFGGILLFLPFSHHRNISFIDALFTSVSAVSVTGLTVLNTEKDFTKTGQVIILILIQIGGLGIMTFVVLTTIFLKRKLGIGIKEIVGEEYAGRMWEPKRAIITAIIYTLSIEFLGFVIFLLSFWNENVEQKIFVSLFHSIAAFCNAGFSTFSNSLEGFRNNYALLLCTSFLIFLGGIGFINGVQILERITKRKRRLTLNAKISLSVSAVLILLGWIILLIGEMRSWEEGIFSLFINSLFQAITPRTAGFSSIKISEMHGISSFTIWILMMIGASSGSCGGGVKTNTLGAIFSYIKGKLKGFKNASVFGRRINDEIVEKAISIFVFYIAILTSGILLLLWTESWNNKIPSDAIFPIFFEVTSALSTVGLSFGITPSLSTGGKIVIIMLMLIGKIGIYSFIYGFLMRKRRELDFEFPEEDIIVG